MANFRALQPARMDEELSPPLPPQNRPLLIQKPKRTVTLGACVACRKRKSKCDGNRPICTCCTQKDTGCVYELGPNEKPSQAMKRKNEEMQGELSNLRQLYEFLRSQPEQEAMEILRRIRANPPDTPPSQRIAELADFARHGGTTMQQSPQPPPPQSPYQHHPGTPVNLPSIRLALESQSNQDSSILPFPSVLSMGIDGPSTQRPRYTTDADVSARSDSQGSRPPPASIEAILDSPSNGYTLADPRLASAANWTSVTNNTNVLSSILSSWTTHEYSYYHYLDRDAFLDDMASGRTDYCSQLLVNALLATACSTSWLVKDRSKPFSELSLMTAFFKEAARLWDLVPDERSITKLQAGICLYLFLGKHGRDKVGHMFLVEACQIGRDLGLFEVKSSYAFQQSSSVAQGKHDSIRAVTAWSLFNFQLNMAFTYCFPAIIETMPSVAIPYQNNSDTEARFRSECAKHIIILDCVKITQNSNEHSDHDHALPDPEQVEACYRRLTSWWQSRSPSLSPEQNPSQENLLCAMMYHVNIINLFQPLSDPSSPLTPHLSRACSITSTTLTSLRRLLALQESRHGWSSTITLVLHPLSVTSFGTLDQINQTYQTPSDAKGSEMCQGLLVCLRALATLCSYNFYAQPLFRLLTQKCVDMGLQLPAEVQAAADYYMSDEWTRNAANIVSSQYIADMRRNATESENARMDAIISAWEGLSLEERGKGKGRSVLDRLVGSSPSDTT